MKRMLFVAMALVFSTAVLANNIQIERLTELHAMEASPYIHAQGGFVFSGKIILNNVNNSLEMYDAASRQRVTQISFPHSVGLMLKAKSNEFYVVGKTSSPWRTFASLVRFDQSSLTIVKTINIPEQYQIDKMAIVDGKLFFNERGDRAVITKGLWGYNKLPFSISGPDDMVGLGNELWMIESRGIGHGDESLSVYNTKTGDYQTLLLQSIGGRGISNILAFADENLIAIDDSVGGRIILIDAQSKNVQFELAIGPDIRAMQSYGQCIAALRTSDHELVWLKLEANRTLTEIERWDISSNEFAYQNPISIAVDEYSAKVSVKSIQPCAFCDPTEVRSAIFSLETDLENIRRQCK